MSTDVSDWSDVLLNAKVNAELPAEPTPLVYIIGAGPVGTALAGRLTRAGVPVAGLHGRDPALAELGGAAAGAVGTSGDLPEMFDAADVVIISVRDARIREVVEGLVSTKRLRSNQILLHTAGNYAAAQLLEPARKHVRGIGTMHPLASLTNVPRGNPPLSLAGAAFAIEGDAPAKTMAEKVVRLMGGRPLFIDPANLSTYHAAAVLASNYVTTLTDVARNMLVAAGVAPDDALPGLTFLLGSVLANLRSEGLPGALTGPVVRGDVATVEAHLAALEARAPEAVDLYKRLGRETLRLAREKNRELSGAAVDKLASVFGGSAAPAPKHKNGAVSGAGAHAAGKELK